MACVDWTQEIGEFTRSLSVYNLKDQITHLCDLVYKDPFLMLGSMDAVVSDQYMTLDSQMRVTNVQPRPISLPHHLRRPTPLHSLVQPWPSIVPNLVLPSPKPLSAATRGYMSDTDSAKEPTLYLHLDDQRPSLSFDRILYRFDGTLEAVDRDKLSRENDTHARQRVHMRAQ